MRNTFIAGLALCLGGCGAPDGKARSPCPVAEQVRVEMQGGTFTFPVTLEPSIFGVSKDARLPSFQHRDARGAWAYCQRATDPPAKADTVSFYPNDVEKTEARFLIIGRKIFFTRPFDSRLPMHAQAGFEVTLGGPVINVFSRAGGVRPTPILAYCTPGQGNVLRACRISFVTRTGIDVTFDLDGEHPLTEWADIIFRVDSYVTAFEAMK